MGASPGRREKAHFETWEVKAGGALWVGQGMGEAETAEIHRQERAEPGEMVPRVRGNARVREWDYFPKTQTCVPAISPRPRLGNTNPFPPNP